MYQWKYFYAAKRVRSNMGCGNWTRDCNARLHLDLGSFTIRTGLVLNWQVQGHNKTSMTLVASSLGTSIIATSKRSFNVEFGIQREAT